MPTTKHEISAHCYDKDTELLGLWIFFSFKCSNSNTVINIICINVNTWKQHKVENILSEEC